MGTERKEPVMEEQMWYAVYGLPYPEGDWQHAPSHLIAAARDKEDLEHLLPTRNGDGYFNAYLVEIVVTGDTVQIPLRRFETYQDGEGFLTPLVPR